MLDFGGPVLVTPFELAERAEVRLGVAPGSLDLHGPFDPSRDPAWLQVLSGELSERGYWARRAEDFARLTGRDADTRELIGALYHGEPADVLIRPDAVRLIEDAKAAQHPVGVLSNDLRAFHSDEWVDSLDVLRLVDVVVDGSVEAFLKPDPRIYRLLADRLGAAVEGAVFLDDQPVNLAGAEAVGMLAVRVDVTEPGPAFAQARALLGLPSAVGVPG